MRPAFALYCDITAVLPAVCRDAARPQAANDFTTDPDAHSLLGSYLAANLAKGLTTRTAPAEFYRSALTLDPDNDVLLEQAFQSEASEGHWDRAVPLAKPARRQGSENRMAHLLLGLDRFKNGNYATSPTRSSQGCQDGPIGELTSAIARAWSAARRRRARSAL